MLERSVAMLVVHAALLRVGQHFVGLLGLLEFLLRVRIVRAAIRVVLHRQPAERLLQLDVVDVALDTKDFVVITLAHSYTQTRITHKHGSLRSMYPVQQTARAKNSGRGLRQIGSADR